MAEEQFAHYLADTRAGEHVVAVVRHHWFVLFRDIVGLLILFLLPFFFIPFVASLIASGNASLNPPAGFGLFFGALWTLVFWHLLFERWTDYYFDIWIITNLRIVDIDQQGFFKRNVATLLDLDHIQDIETKAHGIIGNLLGFGTVEVQTAGTRDEFEITEVPNPQGVERTIRNTQIEQSHIKKMEDHSIGL